jgi:hypothetical protein
VFLRRCAFVAFLLVLVLFVIRHPREAATATGALAHGLAVLADAVGWFVSSL